MCETLTLSKATCNAEHCFLNWFDSRLVCVNSICLHRSDVSHFYLCQWHSFLVCWPIRLARLRRNIECLQLSLIHFDWHSWRESFGRNQLCWIPIQIECESAWHAIRTTTDSLDVCVLYTYHPGKPAAWGAKFRHNEKLAKLNGLGDLYTFVLLRSIMTKTEIGSIGLPRLISP